VAHKHTGYLVGGTSPFATRKAMPVYMERSIADLDHVYINGGRRGFLVSLSPADVVRVLSATLVDAALLIAVLISSAHA
jgi:Cys-tRNA(Pro) deacylase